MKKKPITFQKLWTEDGERLQGTPWTEYPRPLLKRDSYLCLNGEWDFGVQAHFQADNPALFTNEENGLFDKKILVPFPPESILSGIDTVYAESYTRLYRKKFSLPKNFHRGRIFLHFGGVDQIAYVYVNGKLLIKHVGGYSPFQVELTDVIQAENTLIVAVQDHLSEKILPYGKQSANRGGMWYTPVSGIWQTVWLESTPKEYIRSLTAKFQDGVAKITVGGVKNATVFLQTPNGTLQQETVNGEAFFFLQEPVLWSPEQPYLYRYTVQTEADRAESYFAVRTVDVRTVNGIPRICLNGKPYFFHALLDQGYFSDGIFLPASIKTFTDELLKIKALGFNTVRKHIKIEPQLFYAECDRLGILVWQDMVNNGEYSFLRDTALPTVGFLRKKDEKLHKNSQQRQAFIDGMQETVALLSPHPSVVYWTIFNESWGQFNSDELYERLKALDSTRIIDSTSGWFQRNRSDVESRHIYFRKVKLPKSERPIVLSEFGGYVYKVDEHSFNPEKTYGYGKCATREEFVEKLRSVYLNELLPLVKKGLCAAVYTQVSDVEDETNGLFTYDRKVQKLFPQEFADIAEKLQTEIEK